MSLHVFLREKVDVAIIEVGVGGSYDATNVIAHPVVCGCTSLGIDHQAILGHTIDQIAWHKSGIFKENVPAFTVPQPAEAMDVLNQRAQELKVSSLRLTTPTSEYPQLRDIKFGLPGKHQHINAALAVQLSQQWIKTMEKQRRLTFKDSSIVNMDASGTLLYDPSNTSVTNGVNGHSAKSLTLPESFVQGLSNAQWPGRAQIVETDVWTNAESGRQSISNNIASGSQRVRWHLDGAHTSESIGVCAEWYKGCLEGVESKPNVLIFNCTSGRDGNELLKPLIQHVQQHHPFTHVFFCTNATFATTQVSKKGMFSFIYIYMKRLILTITLSRPPKQHGPQRRRTQSSKTTRHNLGNIMQIQ